MQFNEATPITSTDMLNELALSSDPYIIYVSTADCNVCKSIFPKMMDIVKNYDVPVYSVDASIHQEVAGQLLIFSVPTIIVMVDQKEAYKESRFIKFEQFARICELACQPTP